MTHFLVIGGTGVGKSSTINVLTGKNLAKVGYGSEPQTQKLMGYGAKGYVLWDTPGLGEGLNEDMRHIRLIKELITNNAAYRIQHLLVIVEANKRDYGTVYKVIEEIAKPRYALHVSILMNQADQAMKGRNWDGINNLPTSALLSFLNEQALSTQERIMQNTGVKVATPVFYSAATGYGVDTLDQHLKQLSLEYKNGHARKD